MLKIALLEPQRDKNNANKFVNQKIPLEMAKFILHVLCIKFEF